MIDVATLQGRAFALRIRPGRVAEYRRRHAEVWPELIAALRRAGLVRYDLYLDERAGRVFGHQLWERAPDLSAPEEPVVLRWRSFMADVLEMDGDAPVRDPIELVFHIKPQDHETQAAASAPASYRAKTSQSSTNDKPDREER